MIDCTTQNPCWEQWQGFYARVLTRDIELAKALLCLRVQSLPTVASVSDYQAIETAARLCIDLENARWRQMVRAPFNFAKPSKPEPKKSLSLEDLGL